MVWVFTLGLLRFVQASSNTTSDKNTAYNKYFRNEDSRTLLKVIGEDKEDSLKLLQNNFTKTTLRQNIHIKHGFAFKGEHFSSQGKLILLTPGNFYEKGGFKYTPGKEKYYLALGIRIDEIDRMNAKKEELRLVYPLIQKEMRPMTKKHINFWWNQQPFRLILKGYQGNCGACYKKSNNKLMQMVKDDINYFEFLDYLEKQGDLKRISQEIDPNLEMTEISDRVLRADGPALLFENPKGFSTPVLTNLFGSERRVAAAMGCQSTNELRDVGKLLAFLKEPEPPAGLKDAWDKAPLFKKVLNMATKEVKKPDCQYKVIEKDDIDLSQIPIQTCWPGDVAPLITWGLVITKGPEKKRQITPTSLARVVLAISTFRGCMKQPLKKHPKAKKLSCT